MLQQSSQGFLFTYDDWSDVVRMEKLQYIDNAQYAIIETLFSDFVNYFSAHDRNTKLNLANAYQIKNEAID